MSWYGLLIGISIVMGVEYFQRKNNIIPKTKENWFIYPLIIASLVGARAYEVFDNFTYYQQYPIEILNTRAGGLGIYGALIFGLFYIYIFAKIHKLDFLKITDILVPVIALGQSIGRWGNYINKEIFGIPTYMNFGQFVPVSHRPSQFSNYSYFHPVWLYESVLNLILFIVLIKTNKHQTAKYLIGYGLIRFFLEFIRFDSWTIYEIKVAQIISLLSVLTGFYLIRSARNFLRSN